MDSYTLGDISSFLNSSPSTEIKNDLFSVPVITPEAVKEIYSKPAPKPAGVKKSKRSKTVDSDSDTGTKGTKAPKTDFKELSQEEQDQIESKTLFVGNLPIGLKRKQLSKLFCDFGKITSLRFRSVAVTDLKLGKKVCLKANKINENATSKNAYIIYDNEESVNKALIKNNEKVNDFHIRVDKVTKSKKDIDNDCNNSIFIGNIPFTAQEEAIRAALLPCGEIEYVRLIRDKATNIGKGIGYVKFVDSAGVLFAMKMKDTIEIEGRKLRIDNCKSKVKLDAALNKKEKHDKKQAYRGRKAKATDKKMFEHKAKKGPKGAKPVHPKKKKGLTTHKMDKKMSKDPTKKKGRKEKPRKEKSKWSWSVVLVLFWELYVQERKPVSTWFRSVPLNIIWLFLNFNLLKQFI